MRIILAAFFISIATQSWAAWFSRGYTAEMIAPVYVSVQDGATGGCWTNIGEVTTYIKDKLELAGVDRSNKENENYYLSFIVDGARTEDGYCYGMVHLTFSKFLDNGNGQIALLVIGQAGNYGIHSDNLNEYALRNVSDFFEVFLQ